MEGDEPKAPGLLRHKVTESLGLRATSQSFLFHSADFLNIAMHSGQRRHFND